MALIKDSKPKNSSGSYIRLFENNKKLGDLMSKVQSATISSGYELEKIIKKADC